MRKFLIIFIIFSNQLFTLELNIRKGFLKNANLEAMGSTGMIFGKEVGAVLHSPTAIASCEGKGAFALNGSFGTNNIEFNDKSDYEIFIERILLSLGGYFRIENFVLAYYRPHFVFKDKSPYNHVAFSNFLYLGYNLKFDALSLGIGVNNIFLNTIKPTVLELDISAMYESIIGKIVVVVNDIISYDLNTFQNIFYSNLRLGYGKEFKFLKNNSLKFELEIDDLLFQQNEINFSEKVRAGAELAITPINSEVFNEFDEFKILIRAGLKKLFPTFGIGFNFFNFIELATTFYRDEHIYKDNKEIKEIFSLISFKIGYF